ncbi:MAG: ATP-binding protein [Clostridia bacterium]|nr:ATP-binding protein [Clostridia bacterium]
MQEISLNILDIVQNSIRADATLIEVSICENILEDVFSFVVKDNGCGMSEEMVKRVMDPFVTTRTTRKVGLGISLLKAAANQAGGDVTIESKEGVGTTLKATFSHKHIDRQPLGNISAVMVSLISMNPTIDFIYTHLYNEKEFVLDTRELRKVLGDVSLGEPSVAIWIDEYISDGLAEIYGGVDIV